MSPSHVPSAASQWSGELNAQLTRLLAEGAELAVSHPDGTPAFRAVLARCHRVDVQASAVWIMPLVGGYRPAHPEGGVDYAFDLQITRRRNLTFRSVVVDADDRLVFELVNDQRAVVGPAAADTIGELRRWDTFHAALPADLRTDLDSLTLDTA